MVWVVRIREGYKETFRQNKRPYTTLIFSYGKEVQDFLSSLINYEANPLDLKVFYEQPKKKE